MYENQHVIKVQRENSHYGSLKYNKKKKQMEKW